MPQFRVADTGQHGLTTLEDSLGRRHLARALHGSPAVGRVFHGPRPLRGFAILCDAHTRQLCRVIFEQIDCDPDGPLGTAIPLH